MSKFQGAQSLHKRSSPCLRASRLIWLRAPPLCDKSESRHPPSLKLRRGRPRLLQQIQGFKRGFGLLRSLVEDRVPTAGGARFNIFRAIIKVEQLRTGATGDPLDDFV